MTPPGTALDLRVGWPLYTGMTVAGAAAVVASASALATLARAAGWAGWTPWLLPASVDVGGCVGGWVWLRPGAPTRARRTGRGVAWAGAVTSLVGNGAGHLITTGYLHPGPVLVVIVGAVPAAVLVALAHLAALIPHRDDADDGAPTTRPSLGDTDAGQAAPTTDTTPVTEATDPVDAPVMTPVDGPGDSVDTRTAVLSALHAGPASVAELVKLTGRSRTTIVGHLTALADDGVIARDDDKRYRTVITPAITPDAVNGTRPVRAAP